MLRPICFILMLLSASNAYAEADLQVPIRSGQVDGTTGLGKIEVDGVGAVNLVAQREGNRLVVLAQDPAGTLIGKAETVVGLRETPIYVLTPGGLRKITIFWGVN